MIEIVRTAPFVLLGCLAVAACDEPPPTPQPNESPDVERITGNERIGWDQQAGGTAELATFAYALYVDGGRTELTGASCGSEAGPSGFACSARLPPLAFGPHTLAVAAFIVSGDNILESDRSAPLRVDVTGAATTTTTTGAADWQTSVPVITTDGLQLRLELVASGFEDPVDLTIAANGRIVVAERAGRVRVIDPGGVGRPERLEADLEPVTPAAPGRGELLAIALDPRFDRSGLVFAIEASREGRGSATFSLVRFRMAGGRPGERVVLLDGVKAAPVRPAASLRFGPDGRLYAALDDGGEAGPGGDLASFNGKVLRLNPDGSTPADQAAGSPVYASSFESPRGFDWRAVDGSLWIADAAADGTERVTVVVPSSRDPVRTIVATRYALPRPTATSSVAFHGGGLIPGFQGDLLIAGDEARHILRLRFEAGGGARIIGSEYLLQDRVGPVRGVAVSPLGEIYFTTRDALGRLTR
jgi:glucose/arabinose dehydrogenase